MNPGPPRPERTALRGGLAGLALALGGLVGACGSDPAPPPTGEPFSLAFDCGKFVPYTSLQCSALTPVEQVDQDEVVLAPGELLQAQASSSCGLGHPDCEQKFSLSLAYAALCQVSTGAGVTRVEASFQAQASCVPGLAPAFSSASVGPRWRGRLSLPGPGQLYRVSADASASADQGCKLSVGATQADPLRRGEAPVLLLFVRGPASLDVTLECEGSLSGHSCQNLDPCTTPPDWTREHTSLDLTLEAAPCPDAC